MISHNRKDAQQVEAELQDILHALAANAEQQGMQYVSVLKVSQANQMLVITVYTM